MIDAEPVLKVAVTNAETETVSVFPNVTTNTVVLMDVEEVVELANKMPFAKEITILSLVNVATTVILI